MSDAGSNEKQEQAVAESPEPERLRIGDIKELAPLTEHMSDERKKETLLSPIQVERLKRELTTQAYFGSAASLPMVCKGPQCPLAKTCMLEQVGKAPIGDKCPIELLLMNKWKDEYVATLGVSWEDKIERQAIMDLVETEIMRARANGIIAEEGFILENPVGVNPDTGMPIMAKQKHIALEVADQMSKRQERLLRSLIATREMKHKLGQGSGDRTKQESDLLERIRKKNQEKKAKETGVKDAEVIENSQEGG